MSIYIVKVADDYGVYEYEHGNIKHAKEHFDMETNAKLMVYHPEAEYKYITLFSKIAKNASIQTMKNIDKGIYNNKINKRRVVYNGNTHNRAGF
ncbi:MAG: hypothetical protein WC123_07915 [Bacilli bacterium]